MFQKKSYEEIVDEILEHITKSSARETYEFDADRVKFKLENSPVREIVKVEGLLRGAQHVFNPSIDYRQSGDMIEWIPAGEQPDPATPFFVNYTFAEPSGITDANPGSVVRTIVEAVSREISLLYEELENVYRSAFLDTATGKALDMVVSLLGLERTPPQHATGLVVFGRDTPPDERTIQNEAYVFNGNLEHSIRNRPVSRLTEVRGVLDGKSILFEEGKDFTLQDDKVKWISGASLPDENSSVTLSYVTYQEISVPAGVAVATSSRDPRRIRTFVTTSQNSLTRQLDGRWEAETPVRATIPGREGNLQAGMIQIMPKPPLGIEYVVNKQDIVTGTDQEDDEKLRGRAKKALEAAGKATTVAMESAIRRIEGVRSLLIEDRPGDVPGIIQVIVDGGESEEIARAIDDTRSAGTFVEFKRPGITEVDVNITAVSLPETNNAQVQSAIEDRIRGYLSRLEIGNDIVYGRLTAEVLQVDGVHDLTDMILSLRRSGEPPKTITGENVIMGRGERAQVRNVNVAVKTRE